MSQAQEKIEVKKGDYQRGFETVHITQDESEAVRIARKARKTEKQFIFVTRGDHVLFCRY